MLLGYLFFRGNIHVVGYQYCLYYTSPMGPNNSHSPVVRLNDL